MLQFIPSGFITTIKTASKKTYITMNCTNCYRHSIVPYDLSAEALTTTHFLEFEKVKADRLIKASIQANKKLKRKDDYYFKKINIDRNYCNLNLNIKCPVCNKKQSWNIIPTSYYVVYVLILFLVMLIAMFAYMSANYDSSYGDLILLSSVTLLYFGMAFIYRLIRYIIAKLHASSAPLHYYNENNINDLLYSSDGAAARKIMNTEYLPNGNTLYDTYYPQKEASILSVKHPSGYSARYEDNIVTIYDSRFIKCKEYPISAQPTEELLYSMAEDFYLFTQETSKKTNKKSPHLVVNYKHQSNSLKWLFFNIIRWGCILIGALLLLSGILTYKDEHTNAIPLDELSINEIEGNLVVEGNIYCNYGMFCEKNDFAIENYYVISIEDKFMAICVFEEDSYKYNTQANETFDWIEKNDEEPVPIWIKGVIYSMHDEIPYLEDYLIASGYSEEEANRLIVPFYIKPINESDDEESIKIGVVFLIFGIMCFLLKKRKSKEE